MSLVYKESSGIFWKMRKGNGIQLVDRNILKRENKWWTNFLKSCAPIKVKFGENNFVEPLTPLNSINFSLGLVVQIFLVKG